MKKTLPVLLILVMNVASANGQNQAAFRTKILYSSTDTLFVDSALIVPGTVTVKKDGTQLLPQGYSILNKPFRLVFTTMDSGFFEIRYMPFQTPSFFELRRKDQNIIQPSFVFNSSTYAPNGENSTMQLLSGQKELSTSGNLARGIGFGNKQDIIVNSNLNLQMYGNLGNDFILSAVISDENNPIQPEEQHNKFRISTKCIFHFRKTPWN
jgi:hypothetical protein